MVHDLARCLLMYHAFRKSGPLYSSWPFCVSVRVFHVKADHNQYMFWNWSPGYSAIYGLLLSILIWGSNLLLQCSDDESNPRPLKADMKRQTRLGSGTTTASNMDNPQTKAGFIKKILLQFTNFCSMYMVQESNTKVHNSSAQPEKGRNPYYSWWPKHSISQNW